MATAVSFITNAGESHKQLLLKLFGQADEIIFAVGFLRNSGYQNIKEQLKVFCNDRTKTSTFYIGTGLGETEPGALQGLYKIIKSKVNHNLILCTPDAGIFHPKVYVFRTGTKVTFVTGSSNLTQHGWVVNDEVSMVTETTVHSPEFEQLNSYFLQLYKTYQDDDVERTINRYKKEKEDHQGKFGKVPKFRFRLKKPTMIEIDMPRLARYYEIYLNSDAFIEPQSREDQYIKAKKNLEILATTTPLTDLQFHNLFGPLVGHKEFKPKLWHSGSIHRKTHKTLKYPDTYRDIVRKVKGNLSKPIPEAYNNVIGFLNNLRKAKKIYGVGVNIITEMFLSYNPEIFANLNDNPLTVLEMVGKKFPNISTFKGADYEEYVTLLGNIKDELGMKSFLEIDSFFNYVYWNIKEE